MIAKISQGAAWHIGEVARRAGVRVDTIRYYERLGLMERPVREENGYRRYSAVDLGRLLFIRRAKRLGLSLTTIQELLDVAVEGDCKPLRCQVVEALRQQLVVCEQQLAEIIAFKEELEARYRLALARAHEPVCACTVFSVTCSCLPVDVEELGLPATSSPLDIGAECRQ